MLLCTKCHQIGSRVWPTDAHDCWTFNVRSLSNGRCHGNSIKADRSGT